MPQPGPEKIRLSKLMSSRGLCSRREADEWIPKGWVRVDGRPVTELGTKVFPDQEVLISPEALGRQTGWVTFLLNKPVGYVSNLPEKGYPAAMDLLRPENRFPQDPSPSRWHPRQLKGLAPAGRLDIDSHGLIVFTQDGRIAKQLIGEHSGVEKEYRVRFQGVPAPGTLEKLRHGLALDGKPLKPARVNQTAADELSFILQEGKKRQIRRMCELVRLRVTHLQRVRIGRVSLGDLPLGQWRYLGAEEKF